MDRFDITAYRALAIAVINLALADARGTRLAERRDAQRFLRDVKGPLAFWCAWVPIDPQIVGRIGIEASNGLAGAPPKR